MTKIKIGVWLAGVAAVLAVVLFKPQYAFEAVKAVMLVIGENQCSCE